MDANSFLERDVLVLGGGPCGGAVALGLRRLGYAVTMVTETRPKLVVQGFTDETLEQLRVAGFSEALQQLPERCEKQRLWNAQLRYRREWLLNRYELDKSISLYLQNAGVHVIEGRAGKMTAYGSGYQVDVVCGDKQLLIPTDFVVEARGRAAPMRDQERVRGEETLTLQYSWHDNSLPPQTVFESFSEGYAWLAALQDGRRFAQLTVSPKGKAFRDKQSIDTYCLEKLSGLRSASSLMTGIPQNGAVTAQASTASLCVESVSANWIRVGDAAIAFDPVTESALAHSLACAMEAPAVINTLIQKPNEAEIACQYYRELLKQTFYEANLRNAEIYLEEQQWCDNEFWQQRHQLASVLLSRAQKGNQSCVKQIPKVRDKVRDNYGVKDKAIQPEMSLSYG